MGSRFSTKSAAARPVTVAKIRAAEKRSHRATDAYVKAVHGRKPNREIATAKRRYKRAHRELEALCEQYGFRLEHYGLRLDDR